MAKETVWRIPLGDRDSLGNSDFPGNPGSPGEVCTVTYTLHRLTGRMTVTVNGDAFTLPAGPLSLRAARREPFRIVSPDGEAEQAVLAVDRQGRATLWFRGAEVAAEDHGARLVVELGIRK
jgi:hypothetical protein